MITRRKKGFTLIELMFVVGLLVLIISIAMPNYMKFRRVQAMRAAANQLQGDLSRASTEALKSEQYVYVYFKTDTATNALYYEISRDSSNTGTVDAYDTLDPLITSIKPFNAYSGAKLWGGGVTAGNRIVFGKGGCVETSMTTLTFNSISGTASGYYSIMISPSGAQLTGSTFEVRVYDSGKVELKQL
ncbi:MAG: prepilin-type N-terminal cleavage/methylation domain-containing protein [Firmicutes bacterium]|nr:prepilin-type N-terminal cleavage/methylation domain-containing protein [Bacillota bacterium]